jgi:DNA-binding CsgD family transcriptional regulator
VIRDLSVPPLPADATGALTEELAANGCQFRELPSLPTRIMVFDRATALVRLDPVDPRRGVLELTDAATVGALVQAFFRHWERATPSQGSAEVHLTARELAVVRLHMTGLTDAAAAGELGLSERTVAYTMRGLMDRFGVTNRFQLGLALSPVLTGHRRPPGHPPLKETDT